MELVKDEIDGIPVYIPKRLDEMKEHAFESLAEWVTDEEAEIARETVEYIFNRLTEEIKELHIECQEIEHREDWDEDEPKAVKREVEMFSRGFFTGVDAHSDSILENLETEIIHDQADSGESGWRLDEHGEDGVDGAVENRVDSDEVANYVRSESSEEKVVQADGSARSTDAPTADEDGDGV